MQWRPQQQGYGGIEPLRHAVDVHTSRLPQAIGTRRR
jgi:hypothetical protein